MVVYYAPRGKFKETQAEVRHHARLSRRYVPIPPQDASDVPAKSDRLEPIMPVDETKGTLIEGETKTHPSGRFPHLLTISFLFPGFRWQLYSKTEGS